MKYFQGFFGLLAFLLASSLSAQTVNLSISESAATELHQSLTTALGDTDPETPPPPAESQPAIWWANSGNSSEKVTTMPVTVGTGGAQWRVIYSIALPDLEAGDLIDARGQFEVTNDNGYNAMVARTLILATSATATTGTEISETAAQNVTPDMHHQINLDYGTYRMPAAATGRFVNMISYSAASRAVAGDTLDVETDYGRLEVKVFRSNIIE